ncbi:MAG: hypothetical protein HQ582_01140 [Planctomycetes bacterium]|nr:hypothetical protein [Planctomycetota bacterium]
MKGKQSHQSARWEMHDHSDVAVRVAAPSYRRFTAWLDRELDDLVARWSHAAAPNASRTVDFRFRYSKSE